MDKAIWLITGSSSGIGRAMANYAISQDCFVIGTFRKSEEAEDFQRANPNNAKAYVLDLVNHEDILSMINSIRHDYGRIDVLMNNAGYGLMGAIEEIDMKEARAQMELNFFSALYLSQQALALLRKSSKATILQISSSAGVKGEAGLGLYNASKFALEGFSEALSEELMESTIRVCIVEPGPFRTNFGNRSIKESAKKLPEFYKNSAHVLIENIRSNDGKQEGDPEKAVKLIFMLTKVDKPPLHFPLGKFAHEQIVNKWKNFNADIENWKEQSIHTQFDDHG